MARQFTTKLTVAILGTVSAFALNNIANANSHGYYASASSHSTYNPPALSSLSSDVTYAAAPTSFGSSSTYSSAPSYGSSASYSSSLSTAPCPSGSTKQSDGTCLSTSSSSFASGSVISSGSSFGSSSTYSSAPSYGSSSTYSSTPSYSSSTTYSSAPSYSSSSTYSSAASFSSQSTSTAPCPAGSTKQSDGTCLSTTPGFSTTEIASAPLTSSIIGGLGVNESLQPTTCPVAVHNPEGAQVLGCYNVVKPVPAPVVQTRTIVQTVPTVYQVVRPVVYLRYPVPVPCGAPQVINARYGFGNVGRRCGGW